MRRATFASRLRAAACLSAANDRSCRVIATAIPSLPNRTLGESQSHSQQTTDHMRVSDHGAWYQSWINRRSSPSPYPNAST